MISSESNVLRFVTKSLSNNDSGLGRRSFVGAMLAGFALTAMPAQARSLRNDVGRAFRRIGIGPEQTEAYSTHYEKFLKKRNAYIRRVLKNSNGEQVGPHAKRAVKRAAKWSRKDMNSVLDELQLKYYAEYLELVNELFLKDSGLT